VGSDQGETRRVQFRAPTDLVERTDSLATVLETDRTSVILSALKSYLRDAAHDDELVQQIAEAYYADEIGYEELQDLVGHEEAANFRVLKTQLSESFREDAAEELADG
jgi:predicted transcriptional regulator